MFNLFLTFVFEINSKASEYKPLQDQDWSICNSSSFVVNYNQQNLTVNYRICSNDTDIPNKQELITITQKIFGFAIQQNLVGGPCIALEELEIYKVNLNILNDRNRFPKWLNQDSNQIWGLYDPRLEETNIASIILTEQGDYWDKVILSHELSHYWYDRLCWNRAWSKSPEQFALDIEKYIAK